MVDPKHRFRSTASPPSEPFRLRVSTALYLITDQSAWRVSDLYVQSAFGRVMKTGDKVICCADPDKKFLGPAGLVQDLSHVGFGERAKRFALVIDDCKVRAIASHGGRTER